MTYTIRNSLHELLNYAPFNLIHLLCLNKVDNAMQPVHVLTAKVPKREWSLFVCYVFIVTDHCRLRKIKGLPCLKMIEPCCLASRV